MSERKVKIESTVKYPVVIALREFRFNRTFNKELQSTFMDFEVAEEALQIHGFRQMLKNGVLRFPNKQDRIDLGLESEEEVIEENIALTTKEIIGYLKGGEKALKDILKKVSNDLLSRFVNVAITSKISDYKVINALNAAAKDRAMDIDMTALFKLASDAEKPVADTEE